MRATTGIVLAAAALLALAGPASAAKRIFSYDSANAATEQMTQSGLTFVFDRTPFTTRVLQIMTTFYPAQAEVRPASQSVLGPGGLAALIGPNARERDLYEIEPKGDGQALIRALCPGADHAWLAFGAIRPDEPLRIHAIGHDPQAHQFRLCATLDYSFRGQWDLGPPALPQPDRSDRFNDAPENRRY